MNDFLTQRDLNSYTSYFVSFITFDIFSAIMGSYFVYVGDFI